jgi:hypothetical protein
MEQSFATQNAALQQQVEALVGADGLAQFNDYNKNLASTLTAQQFKDEMTGTDAEKAAKVQQLTQLMQTQVTSALANANLPADYQIVPTLNFANIASESQGNESLKLLGDIYRSVVAQTSSFLSPDEQTKFEEFTAKAISNNRIGLTLNRTLMAPLVQ